MKITKKKLFLCLISVVLLIAIICVAIYFKRFLGYKQIVKNISLSEIDTTKLSNGVYIGECDVDFIYAKVEVTVNNGKIENISILEHRNERGKSAESVVDKIFAEQQIDVAAIAGATNSSTVLKKAVANALVD